MSPAKQPFAKDVEEIGAPNPRPNYRKMDSRDDAGSAKSGLLCEIIRTAGACVIRITVDFDP